MHLLLALFLSVLTLGSDGEPKAERGTFALTNARIVTVSDGVIERGTLLIQGADIVALGTDVAIPADAQVIDCTGLSVYPGLIDAGTRLGLVEVNSDPRTRDYNEVGDLTPHVQALTAVNPNSVLVPVTRVGGVTTVLTEPSGGLLPGTAALINLHGYTPEQMHVGPNVMVLEYPTTGRRGWWDRRSEETIAKEAEKALDRLDELFDRAELYAQIDSAYAANPSEARMPEYVPEMKAMLPVVRGTMPLMIKVDVAKDILSALEWVERRGFDNVVLSGVAEGWRVADEIAEAGLPAFVGPVLSVPTRGSDRYDKPYRNAALLSQAGVKIALRTGEAENVRNLPFHAGFAAAFGLGAEEALRAVTLNTAEIFGVSNQIGSLETGKRATLIVTDGDPFEPMTQIRHVFIDGYNIPLESRQTRLYDEFLQREPGLEKHPQKRVGTN